MDLNKYKHNKRDLTKYDWQIKHPDAAFLAIPKGAYSRVYQAKIKGEKITCECGMRIAKTNHKHKDTKVHKDNMYYLNNAKIKCVCSSPSNMVLIPKCKMQQHLKTRTHSENIEQKCRDGFGHIYDLEAKFNNETEEFYFA